MKQFCFEFVNKSLDAFELRLLEIYNKSHSIIVYGTFSMQNKDYCESNNF